MKKDASKLPENPSFLIKYHRYNSQKDLKFTQLTQDGGRSKVYCTCISGKSKVNSNWKNPKSKMAESKMAESKMEGESNMEGKFKMEGESKMKGESDQGM